MWHGQPSIQSPRVCRELLRRFSRQLAQVAVPRHQDALIYFGQPPGEAIIQAQMAPMLTKIIGCLTGGAAIKTALP